MNIHTLPNFLTTKLKVPQSVPIWQSWKLAMLLIAMLGYLTPTDSFGQCRNITSAGYIAGGESQCGSYDPSTIYSQASAYGGSGGYIEYLWQKRVAGGNWTNIGGAYSTSYNPPTITQTTQYRRLAKRSRCSTWYTCNTITKTVTPGPTAIAGGGGIISCVIDSVQLTGNSNTPGVIYSWTGPWGFSSQEQNPFVYHEGTFVLTVTDPATGCKATDQVGVLELKKEPTVTATGGNFDCASGPVHLSSVVTPNGVTYQWTGPNGFNSTIPSPSATDPGVYTLTVTDTTNGCVASDTALVTGSGGTITAHANGGTLTCTQLSIQLSGSSSTPGARYSWTGPNGFTSSQQNPTVNTAGIYTLTTSDPSGLCTATDTALVSEDQTPPGAHATGGPISCSTGSLQLSGSSNTQGVSYSWTGPGGFASTQQNPTVTTAGTYTLTVTNPTNGCTSMDTALVSGTSGNVDALASGGTITCTTNSIQLNGSSTTAGATFSWTGPGGFTSTQQNPTVTTAGIYTLTVADASGICTASDTALVNEDANLPGATALGATLTCVVTTVQLQGNSPANGVTYSWTGPNGFTSTQQNPSVTVAGMYTLTVSNPANGCTSTATAQVLLDNTAPNAVAQGGALSCTNGTIVLTGSSTTAGVTYSWTGPGGFTSTQQNPTASTAGTYTLTVTNPVNGCTATDTAIVTGTGGNVDALASGGTITCATNSIQLNGSSTTAGATFSWTGPGGFTSTQQNPTATAAGIYTLTVTDASGICTATDTALVNEDANLPGATATGGTLTCVVTTIQLQGNSPANGVTYSWTGPNGFTSTQQNPSVTVAGTYTLTVSNPSNGCSSTATAQVLLDNTAPDALAQGGNLSCATGDIALSGSSTIAGATYSWTGPGGFTSTQQNPTVSTAGTYTLTVTNPVNGCTATDTAIVTGTGGNVDALASGGTITCATNSIQLNGSSTTAGATFSWTGPGGFTSTQQNPTATAAGIYTLTVTDASGICTATDTALVNEDANLPGATATGGTLTCVVTTIQLQGNSPANGVTYSWTGPNGFTSTQQNPSVTVAGTYTLTVSNPSNGCSSTATAQVLLDNTAPDALAQGGNLSCATGDIALSGSSTIAGATYSWTGPGGFTSTQQNPTVSTAGNYTLTVTNPVNGCTATDTAMVVGSGGNVDALASGGTITCTTNSVQLSGSSTSVGVSFSWTGPGGFNSTQQNPTVTTAGIYTLTVTDASGICTASDTALVDEDADLPGASIQGGDITCLNTSVQLTGSSLANGVSFSWTGPNGFSSTISNPVVSDSGTYVLTVLNPVNGCSSSASTIVTSDTTSPGAIATGNVITSCINRSVPITGDSPTAGVTFSWAGPNGFTSTDQNPVVSDSGTYVLTVTNPLTGCTSSASALVIEDTADPGALATGGTLTCDFPSINLQGASGTFNNITFSWTGPNGFTSTDQNPTVNQTGTYTLVVTNTISGCTSSDTTVVDENTTVPGATATGGSLTCTATSIQISGNSPTAGVLYNWTGPNGFASSAQNPSVTEAGTYTVLVTDPTNGCTSTATAQVTQDANVPNVSATGGAITCTNTSIQITGNSTTAGVTYSWTGPNGFTSMLQNPTVTEAGNYILTVTDPTNGCTASATAVVADSTAAPGVQVTGGELTCIVTSVQLSSTSATAGITYSWTGPNGFTSTDQNPTVSAVGNYTVTVTNPATGCTSSATATVTADTTAPNISASASGPITCVITSIQISGNSTTSGVTYSWTGPNGFTATTPSASVSVAGVYTLVITDTDNGCTSSLDVVVSEDITEPGATANGNVLTCTAQSVQITGSSPTAGVSYSWTGPGGFTSADQNPTVTAIGTYTLTVTNPTNGCVSTDTAQVTQDINVPDVSAVGGTLTCTVTSLQLSGASSTPNAEYSWTGPNGFTSSMQNPSVTEPGVYTLTVTDPTNSCTASADATVLQDIAVPVDVEATAMSVACADSIQVMGATSTDSVSYGWAGPGGFTSTQQNPFVTASGTYTLTVTDTRNGCTATDTANVLFEACAVIGDFVFEDANRNGIQNTGENGIQGVIVELLDPAGTVVATDTTDAQGLYEFNVRGGDYSVRFVQSSFPGGFVISRQDLGTDDAIDSDPDPVTGETILNTFTTGVSDLDWDAGAYLFNCNANAGSLVLVDTCLEICIVDTAATIVANLDGTQSVPPGFETVYFLTRLPGNIIIQTGNTPNFQVGLIGVYTMHSMVVDTNPGSPDFVDLSQIVLDSSSITDVQSLIGVNVCADLDLQGIQAQVTQCPGPLALDDFNNLLQDTTVSGNVLTNDSDPFGGFLEVDTVLVIQPANGTVTIRRNGIYTYTPDPGFVGEDEFTYRVCNINLCPPICSEAIVFIEVLAEDNFAQNVAPIANADVMAIEENKSVDMFVTSNDFDQNGNPLSNPTPDQDPLFGSVTYNANGSITYTPELNFTGRDEFTYKVLDNGSPAKYDIGKVIIHVRASNSGVHGQPIAVDDAIITGVEQEVRWDVSNNDLELGNSNPTYSLVEPPLSGVMNSFNESNGLFSYTPAPGFVGMDKFIYESCDARGCDRATVYITVFTTPISLPDDQWNTLKVVQRGPDAKLSWSTLMEVNSAIFEIERSEDGITYTKVGTTPTSGNSLTQKTYQYIDDNVTLLNQSLIYYRVKLIGIDGSHSFSPIAELVVEEVNDIYLNAYPNPAKSDLTVDWTSGSEVDGIRILNQLGQTVFIQKPDADKRAGVLNLDVSKWGRGLYYVHVYSADHVTSHRLFLE